MTRDQYRRELLTSWFAKIGTLSNCPEIVEICRRIIHKLQMKNFSEEKNHEEIYAIQSR